ncbi:hypothetical protein YWIDRAFT_07803 [Streptomyces sp. SceaMP-e96]|uniref:hypothetical protein n=1 Tax=unclassified Streptomyces TaxID=2593676 RepID=UPI000823EFB0|nr:hypothetical protein [Streptomyces sp. SceaMP-e96]SCK51237.1 hypothetical protein YWIDRAFT_07803 [Streptomyces sp. SceaMP-e96]
MERWRRGGAHLQKASAEQPQRQAWGTDGFKRKGGDFFGAAADAPDRPPYQPRRRKHDVPSWTRAGEPTSAAVWQGSVQRLLAAVARRAPNADWLAGWSQDIFIMEAEGLRVFFNYALPALIYLAVGHGAAAWLRRL